MKSMLMYFYNLKNPFITKTADGIYVKENKKLFIFKKTENNNEEIFNFINKDKTFYKVVKNKNKNYITTYKDDSYVLFEVCNSIALTAEEIFSSGVQVTEELDNDWADKWIIKLEQIDRATMSVKNEFIYGSRDYYIGMGENAINFLIYNKDKVSNSKKYICRKRIDKKIIRFPTNAIVDNKERNLGETIKYLFFQEDKTVEEIISFAKKNILKTHNKYLIFSRLLFPTYFFDVIDEFFKDNESVEEKIKKILNKSDDYELLLSNMFDLFFNDKEHKLEWNKKRGS